MRLSVRIAILILLPIHIVLGQMEDISHAAQQPRITANDTVLYLNLPDRQPNALEGSEFVNQVTGLSIIAREQAAVEEILAGNIPSFARKLREINITRTIGGTSYELELYAVCDYMAIGSDQDYFYIPMTPSTAQYLADTLGYILPTKNIVDEIYNSAEIKLTPKPIPPSPAMTTVPVFWQHTDSIKQQFAEAGIDRSADNIIGGSKKDVIISNKIYSADRTYERVVIYGWHWGINNPIQPVYNGHIAAYADYSHGVRLVLNHAILNGDSVQVVDILKDTHLWSLLSNEGVISKPFYPPSPIFTSLDDQSANIPIDFLLDQNYPNPFNPSTTINYQLSSGAAVDLSVFNLIGQKVATLVAERQPAGSYQIQWDAKAYSSGVYLYRLQAGLAEASRKMVLLR